MLRFAHFALAQTNKSDWMEYKKDAEGTVKHGKWQISSFDEWVSEGGPQNPFSEKVGHLAQPADPPPPPRKLGRQKKKEKLNVYFAF